MIELTDEEAREISKRAEKHLDDCHEALWDDTMESPAWAPFCGCTVCVVREVLWAAIYGGDE